MGIEGIPTRNIKEFNGDIHLRGDGVTEGDVIIGRQDGIGDDVKIESVRERAFIDGGRICPQVDFLADLATFPTTGLIDSKSKRIVVTVLHGTAEGDKGGGHFIYYATGRSGITLGDDFKAAAGTDDYYRKISAQAVLELEEYDIGDLATPTGNKTTIKSVKDTDGTWFLVVIPSEDTPGDPKAYTLGT